MGLARFAEDEDMNRWSKLAEKRVVFQELASRICWLGYGERGKFGLALNDLVARGELKAPIVIGRDHLDCGSGPPPSRGTEAQRRGPGAGADRPFPSRMPPTASAPAWCSSANGCG